MMHQSAAAKMHASEFPCGDMRFVEEALLCKALFSFPSKQADTEICRDGAVCGGEHQLSLDPQISLAKRTR